MVEKYNIRTDLALEEKERFESDHVEVQGVILTEEYDEENEIRITTMRIETENGAKVMGKPVGSYITIEAPEMAVPDEGYHEEISQQLRKFIGELLPKRKITCISQGISLRSTESMQQGKMRSGRSARSCRGLWDRPEWRLWR